MNDLAVIGEREIFTIKLMREYCI